MTVTQKAYRFVFSHAYILLGQKPRLDMRFNYSKEVMREFNRISKEISEKEKQRIKNLWQLRAANRMDVQTNVLSRPLVRDWRANRGFVKRVWDDRIEFYGRNHWAKDNLDRKILNILKNY